MASLLPADVISEILQYLKDDTKTLYSGLFVNKLWCHVVVPLLWRDPWEIAKSQRKWEVYNFLRVLCGCLSEDSKNLLLDLGLEFQIQYPRFDYASYIRVINSRRFNESITQFCSRDRDNFKRQLVEKELYLLVISHSPAIKHLRVDFTLEHPLLYFPGAHTSFSKLNEICCDLKRLPQLFLSDLTNISKNIQQIHIMNYNADEYGLAKLINAQSGLTSLHLESEKKGDGLMINKELEVHASSLKHFIMESPYLISATSLYSCIWLETLKLDTKSYERVIDLTTSTMLYESFMNSLASATFPNLCNLHLRVLGYCPTSILKVAENLVVRSGGKLRSLFLHGIFKKEQVKPSLLQNIAKYCPKLKYLSVWIISNDDIRYLEQLLSSCLLLKGIIVNTWPDVRIDGDELLKLFKRRLSRKLCKFKFDDYLSFSLDHFLTFMNCWNQVDPLHIHVIDASVFGFNCERVCSSFGQRGILKSFIEVNEFLNFSWDNVEGENLLEYHDSYNLDSDGLSSDDSDEEEENNNESSEDESEDSEDIEDDDQGQDN